MFKQAPIVLNNTVTSNAHSASASLRTSADLFINRYITSVAKNPYSMSTSTRDCRLGIHGTREFWMAKDAAYTPHNDTLEPDDAIKMIDVDYYDEALPDALILGRPLLMYTFVPTTAGTTCPDYSYCFSKNGTNVTVTQTFLGSGTYTHRLWDLSTDHCYVNLPNGRQHYSLERRWLSADRCVTLFSPTRRIDYDTSWTLWFLNIIMAGQLLDYLLPGKLLQRWQPSVTDDTIAFPVRRNSETIMTVGRLDTCMSTEIPLHTYDILLSRAAEARTTVSKTLSIGTVANYIGASNSHHAGYVMYHVTNTNSKSGFVDHYETPVAHYDTLGLPEKLLKPTLRPLFNPIIPSACFTPVSSAGSMQFAIDKRILEVRKPIKRSAYLTNAMAAFIEQLVPREARGTLTPASFSRFVSQMTKPQQRAEVARIGDAFMFLPEDTSSLETFMKVESYAKVAPPRIITTYATTDKARYSLYCYSLSDYIKTQSWYAFGLNPNQIQQSVMKLLMRSPEGVVTTDFTKFDGTISMVLRDLERQVLSALFHASHVSDVLDMHAHGHNRVVAPKGCKPYDLFTARGSGSPETSIMNSICNAFFLLPRDD
jgi:hypothetical protein